MCHQRIRKLFGTGGATSMNTPTKGGENAVRLCIIAAFQSAGPHALFTEWGLYPLLWRYPATRISAALRGLVLEGKVKKVTYYCWIPQLPGFKAQSTPFGMLYAKKHQLRATHGAVGAATKHSPREVQKEYPNGMSPLVGLHSRNKALRPASHQHRRLIPRVLH